jgi:hypothetical protein
MRRIAFVLLLAFATAVPARALGAPIVGITASPNPAVLGDRVVHRVNVGVPARLDVWVSAMGFDKPRPGTLPPGTWQLDCCAPPAVGSPAWHYRSTSPVRPSTYRFGASAVGRGSFAAAARVMGVVDVVWVHVT